MTVMTTKETAGTEAVKPAPPSIPRPQAAFGDDRSSLPRFFCDLDHTLIYSHRIPLGCAKVVVERLAGADQSFMTSETLGFLRGQRVCDLIPLTTRSPAQFDRLAVFHREIPCRHALICNGGVLLSDGCEDLTWRQETMRLLADELPGLHEAAAAVKRASPSVRVRDVCGMFFYFKHDSPAAMAGELRRVVSQETIRIHHDRRKVYCLPRSLHKGLAVERYQRKFGPARTIGAGDSDFDIPMLSRVDVALVPPDLAQGGFQGTAYVMTAPVFSDGICRYLLQMDQMGNVGHGRS